MPTLKPPAGAGLDVIQAAKYGVQINLGTTSAPQWTWVNGLQSWEPKTKVKQEDDSDITYDGWESMANAGNAYSVDFDGLVKGVNEAGEFTADPGMWALKVAAEQTGSDGHVHMRMWRTDGLPEAKEFFAVVDASLKGGKPNELQKFGGSLTGRGKPTEITKPGEAYALHYGFGTTAYTATVDGQTTASIAVAANLAAIKAALELLTTVTTATVTGAAPDFAVTLDPVPTTTSATGTGGTVTFSVA